MISIRSKTDIHHNRNLRLMSKIISFTLPRHPVSELNILVCTYLNSNMKDYFNTHAHENGSIRKN